MLHIVNVLLVALLLKLPDHSLVISRVVRYDDDLIGVSKQLPPHLSENPMQVTEWFPSTVEAVVGGSVPFNSFAQDGLTASDPLYII